MVKKNVFGTYKMIIIIMVQYSCSFGFIYL